MEGNCCSLVYVYVLGSTVIRVFVSVSSMSVLLSLLDICFKSGDKLTWFRISETKSLMLLFKLNSTFL